MQVFIWNGCHVWGEGLCGGRAVGGSEFWQAGGGWFG